MAIPLVLALGLVVAASAAVAEPRPPGDAVHAPPAAADPPGWAAAPGCDCATPPVASFVHELRDGRHVTATGIVVPAPYDEVSRALADLASYPSWLFAGPGGVPTLHGLEWDRDSGALRVRVGSGGKGLPLAGTLSMHEGASETTLRASGASDDVKEWAFELTARPDAGCATRCAVALRLEILFGLKARVFGGSAKSMPLLLALVARDDLAARFVTTPARMQCVGLGTVSRAESGRPLVTLDGGAPVEVVSCRPHALAVGADRARAFGARLEPMQSGRKGDVGDLLDAMVEAISGRHAVVSWRLDVRGRAGTVVLGDAPASVHAGAVVRPEKEGFALLLSAGASK